MVFPLKLRKLEQKVISEKVKAQQNVKTKQLRKGERVMTVVCLSPQWMTYVISRVLSSCGWVCDVR